MGAGQIGGIATLLDIDFENAAGFVGMKAEVTEAQFMVYYFSHAMLFCVGALIEPHVILTPASCVFGERYKFDVFGGSHKFLENAGTFRQVHHICIHKGYNHTKRWTECSTDNLALMILDKQFSFHAREPRADFVMNRVRYGLSSPNEDKRIVDSSCRYYGWGSRRNGFLIPLLIELRRVNVKILPPEKCLQMWNYNNKYLCVQQRPCKACSSDKNLSARAVEIGVALLLRQWISAQFLPPYNVNFIDNSKSEKFGALCPDDLGSVIVCSGFVQGMMTSRVVDRPCGVGFTDLQKFSKFLTCGVDESRDVVNHDELMAFDYTPFKAPTTPTVITRPPRRNRTEQTTIHDKKKTH